MDFTFTDEQKMITESLNKWFLDQYDFQKRCQWIREDCRHQQQVWKGLADLGMLALPFSNKYGGMQATVQDMGVVLASAGQFLLLEPLLQHYLTAKVLTHSAPEAVLDTLVPQLVSGDRVCVAAFAPMCDAGLLVDASGLTAQKNKQGNWCVSGYLPMVMGAGSATDILAVAKDAAGDRHVFILPVAAMEVQKFYLIDDTSAANFTIDGLEVSDRHCFPYDERLFTQARHHAVALLGYEAVAIMAVLNEKTQQYLKTREQFGQPLSKFQVLQHRLVEMHVQEELARSIVMAFAIMTDDLDTTCDIDVFSYQAKLKINDYCQYVGEQSVQLHGGMGVSDELDIAHYFRRLTCIRHLFGDQAYALSRGLQATCAHSILR